MAGQHRRRAGLGGYAEDYAEAMWMMLQAGEAQDHVVATGTSKTVRDFVQIAIEYAGLEWERHAKFDPRDPRPTEADDRIGKPSQGAETAAGWEPHTPPNLPASW